MKVVAKKHRGIFHDTSDCKIGKIKKGALTEIKKKEIRKAVRHDYKLIIGEINKLVAEDFTAYYDFED